MGALGKTIFATAVVATLAAGRWSCSACEYADASWPFTENTEMGRTKNAIATVIAGAAAQQIAPSSRLDLAVEKSWWPDAHVTGYVRPGEVRTDIDDLTFTSIHYAAERNVSGLLEGKVSKSEFDWGVTEEDSIGSGHYHIGRFLFKWDSELDLHAKDGVIKGTYIRHGPSWNWDIQGTYDSTGRVHMDVDVPWGLDFALDGHITPQK